MKPPRLVLKVRTAVRKLLPGQTVDDTAAEETSRSWDAMMQEVAARADEIERRLAVAEQALNRREPVHLQNSSENGPV
jgi:hypothetical protein